MSREATRYRVQLGEYVGLYKALDDSCPIRAALYCPMIDGWQEISFDK